MRFAPRLRPIAPALLAIAITATAACSGAQDTGPTPVAASPDETPTLVATAETPTATEPAPSPTDPPATATATDTPAATEPPTEASATDTPTMAALPASAHLAPMSHDFQTWNNCSAVSASMVLSYFGIERTQAQLGPIFRPNPDDKHVEPRQLVEFFPSYDLKTLIVEGGSIEQIKALVAAGFPVIVPQWLDHNADAIGHYRVVRGYDDARGGFLVNDSMIGADVLFPYDEFQELWRAFNDRFLPVYRPADEDTVRAILGEDFDRQANLERALAKFQARAAEQPDDAYLQFSIGSSLFELGRYEEAVAQYERAEALGLPPKMLWYQFWPVAAYNNIGDHQRAIDLAAAQIASAGAFGEMRYERGRAYEALGNIPMAIAEYRRAHADDANLVVVQEALARLGDSG